MDIPFEIFGSKRCTPVYVKKRYPEFYEFLQEKYPGLIFSEQTFWFYHNLTEHPKCKICGKPTGYLNFNNGYREYCSIKCSSKDNPSKCRQTKLEKYGDENYNNRDKCKKTCLERYGTEYSFQSDSVREKIKQTCIERYGDTSPMKSEIIKEKTKQTCLEKYGVDNALKSKKIRDKAKQTKLERYGDEHYNNRDKCIKTCFEKYGVENVFQTDYVKERSKQTMKEKYGGEYTQTSLILKEKIRQNFIEKYGVDHQSKIPEVKEKILKNNRERYLKSHDFILRYTEDGDWVCKCPHNDCNQCCEKEYIIDAKNYFSRKEFNIEPCTILKHVENIPNKNTTLEVFIQKILDKYNIKYETNNRTILSDKKELDIYIPSKRIAFECNGTYFHSTAKKDNKYHLNKFNDCLEKGIQLITIWEDQIFNIPEIVESVILSKLGIYENIIGARKCEIREITPSECTMFLNENHLQGETKTNVRLALVYNNEIYSVMTFSKKSKLSGSNKINDREWELTRFCNKKFTSITGGFSKLLKHFIKLYNPEIISSFASNDISDGSLYEISGFKKDKVTLSYWYIKKQGYVRYHRSSFTKNKLKQMGYDIDGKTESQIMETLPFYKIYDCGHTKYILNKKSCN